MSLPEVKLWMALKGNTAGLKFRRQNPIGPYVADFYCPAANLMVEIDGKAHDMGQRSQRDTVRDAFMHEKGYTVLRITASAVLQNAHEVAESVVLAAIPLRQPLRGCHLPMNGEDC